MGRNVHLTDLNSCMPMKFVNHGKPSLHEYMLDLDVNALTSADTNNAGIYSSH